MAFSSCTDDDSTDPESPSTKAKPIINVRIDGVENQDNYTINLFEGINIQVTALMAADGESNLATIKMEQNGSNEINIPGEITFISAKGTEYDFSTNENQPINQAENEKLEISKQFADSSNISGIFDTTTYTITVTDDDGVSNTRIFNIIVLLPLKPAKRGEIYHFEGTNAGAFSLLQDSAYTTDSVYLELRNTDVDQAPFTGSFKIVGQNFISLVKASEGDIDFDQSTYQSAEKVYNQENKITYVDNPEINDIFIYHYAGANIYTVLKITAIEPNNNDCNCTNKGKMEFLYKKTL